MNKQSFNEQELDEQDLQAINGGAGVPPARDEFKRLGEIVPREIPGNRWEADVRTELGQHPPPANPFRGQEPAQQLPAAQPPAAQPPAPQQG